MKMHTCPKCESPEVRKQGHHHKMFSFCKAVAGGVLFGTVGLLAGFIGKKGPANYHCMHCGHRWYAH